MEYRSTRGGPAVGFGEAVRTGLAPDGGLYVPTRIPRVDERFLSGLRELPFSEVAVQVASRLLGDGLGGRLAEVVRGAFDFETPVTPLGDDLHVLELFHGPTMAFKDVGARFLARALPLLAEPGAAVTVLVATSGDTGGAVAAAFHGVPGVRVVIVYPAGRVSPFQERQIASLGGNVHAIRIEGGFDDCQRLVKEAFADDQLRQGLGLTSANSINLGRLLPQVFYYFQGWAQLPEGPDPLLVSVPSGNFGNLTAGLIAWRMGLPIRGFVASTNRNDVVPSYLASGVLETGPSVPTISNAMDVGDPSNLERLLWLFEDRGLEGLREVVQGRTYSDDETKAAIKTVFDQYGYVLCPHSAVGYLGLRDALSDASRKGTRFRGMTLATAHPAKFASVVQPILGSVPSPPSTAVEPPDRAPSSVPCAADVHEFRRCLVGL